MPSSPSTPGSPGDPGSDKWGRPLREPAGGPREAPRPGCSRYAVAILSVVALVVVGVVILFPVFAKHRGSRIDSCLSNMKQLALAAEMYAADYDGAFPVGQAVFGDEFDALAGTAPCNWAHALSLYIKKTDVLRCPSIEGERDGRVIDYALCSGTLQHSDPVTGRQLTWPLTVDGYPADAGRLEADYAEPAAAVMLYESPVSTRCGVHDGRFLNPSTGMLDPYAALARHNGGGKCAFIDGHAKWIELDKPPHITQGCGGTPSDSGDGEGGGGDGSDGGR
jgi:prepilin-type processing-associated H-X9-DG protein